MTTKIELKPKESALIIKENGDAELFLAKEEEFEGSEAGLYMGVLLTIITTLLNAGDKEFLDFVTKKGKELIQNSKKVVFH